MILNLIIAVLWEKMVNYETEGANTQVKDEYDLDDLEDEEEDEDEEKDKDEENSQGILKTAWNFIYFNFFHCEPWLDKVGIEIELGNADNLLESSYENWFYRSMYNFQRQTWFASFIYLSILINTVTLAMDQ